MIRAFRDAGLIALISDALKLLVLILIALALWVALPGDAGAAETFLSRPAPVIVRGDVLLTIAAVCVFAAGIVLAAALALTDED